MEQNSYKIANWMSHKCLLTILHWICIIQLLFCFLSLLFGFLYYSALFQEYSILIILYFMHDNIWILMNILCCLIFMRCSFETGLWHKHSSIIFRHASTIPITGKLSFVKKSTWWSNTWHLNVNLLCALWYTDSIYGKK